MKSKFLDTLFDNILNWLGPKKRKRDDISIGEYDPEYPRIPDPQKKVFKSSDSFNSSEQKLNNNNNSSSANQSSDDVPQIIHSVIPVKNNASPRKDPQYQQLKKDMIDFSKENSSQKNKLQNQSTQKVIVLNECNGSLKKTEQKQQSGQKDVPSQEVIIIEEDEILEGNSSLNQDNQYELVRRQSAAQLQIENNIKEREHLDLEIVDLPDIFMEFKQITDEWVASDLDFIEEKMANLDLKKEETKEKQDEMKKKDKQKPNEQQFGVESIFSIKSSKKNIISQLLEEFNQIYDLKTKKQKVFFWKFEESQLKKVQDVFERNFNLNDEIIVHTHILEKLSYKNLQTLRQTNWLNDEVINAYIRLITHTTNAVILNTFFYPELTKNTAFNKIKRIATKNRVTYKSGSFYIPLNINGQHWAFVEVNNDTNQIIYYDSLASKDRDYSNHTKYFQDLMSNLQKDDGISADKIKKYQLVTGSTGQQENGYDCGVFMLKGIHYRSCNITGLDLWVDQSDTSYYRYLIAYQLIQGKIEVYQQP